MARSLKIYTYDGCSTSSKALRYLDEQGFVFKTLPIRETPPTREELKKMLAVYGGNKRKLFNTSGKDYKEMNLKESLDSLSDEEAIELLASHGNLIKRPFLLVGNRGVVGFKQEEWDRFLATL